MPTGQTHIVTFDDIRDYLASKARTAGEKGDLWERVTAWFLRNDPEWRQVVGRVWRWDDAGNPMRTGHEDRDGRRARAR